ncbi:MAG: hypothetical protein RMJ28_00895 [Nitrososphaerota archaeon]|nr:hypothetical protein [Candidatus Calditenuaceae archaeon]MDW8072789.1 hypothetical protein [Nitrososphaerota archaeon]
MRIVDLSAELYHMAFLPVSRRKLVITGAVFAALSLLLIILNPSEPLFQQAPSPTLLILITSIILILIALSTDRSLIKSVDAATSGDGRILHIGLIFKKPLSGLLETGEITAAEFLQGDSLHTSYSLRPEKVITFQSTTTLRASIVGGPVTGLIVGGGEKFSGIFKCPGLKISITNGPEVYMVWVNPIRDSFRVELEKSSLYSNGAQCSLSYGSKGGVNYLLSAADKARGLLSNSVTLKLSRVLKDGLLNLKHEEVVAEIKSGEAGSGVWQPRTYDGEDVLILFSGSRRLKELLYALKSSEFVADPAPGVDYAFVLESKGRFQSERDIARVAINSSWDKEEKE